MLCVIVPERVRRSADEGAPRRRANQIARFGLAGPPAALDVAFGATPPVIIAVFDQLPLISLLDADGRIDPALYPTLRGAGQRVDMVPQRERVNALHDCRTSY